MPWSADPIILAASPTAQLRAVEAGWSVPEPSSSVICPPFASHSSKSLREPGMAAHDALRRQRQVEFCEFEFSTAYTEFHASQVDWS